MNMNMNIKKSINILFSPFFYDMLNKEKCMLSIKNNIPNSTIYGEKTIQYYSNTLSKNIENLRFNYNMMCNLIKCLVKQLQYLRLNNLTFVELNIKDIMIIDEYTFVIINFKNVIEIKNNYITIDFIFDKTPFICPLLQNIKSLPSKVNSNVINYNIGTILIYILTQQSHQTRLNDYTKINYLRNTKLYKFIVNCIDNYSLLFIF